MSITVIPAGETSRAPKLPSVRTRLLEMASAMSVTASAGGGLGPAELDQVVRELRTLGKRSAENDVGDERMTILEAVALAFSDLDEAEARLRETRIVLARQVDKGDADPDGRVTSGISTIMSLCQRAQATIGATRLVRS